MKSRTSDRVLHNSVSLEYEEPTDRQLCLVITWVSGFSIKDCVHLDCFLRKRDSFKHSSTLLLPGKAALPYSPDSSPRAYLIFIYSIGSMLGAGDTAVERQRWLLLAVKQEPLTKRYCIYSDEDYDKRI